MAYLVMEYLPGHHAARAAEGLQDAHAPSRPSTSWTRCCRGSPPRTRPASCTATSSPRTCCSPTTAASRSATSASRAPPARTPPPGSALLGTIAYLSPELVTRGVADARSDIYAVGIMLYEMLAGEQPYKGEQPMQIAYQHANDTVPTPSVEEPRRAGRARRARAVGDGARPRRAAPRRLGDARAAARDAGDPAITGRRHDDHGATHHGAARRRDIRHREDPGAGAGIPAPHRTGDP